MTDERPNPIPSWSRKASFANDTTKPGVDPDENCDLYVDWGDGGKTKCRTCSETFSATFREAKCPVDWARQRADEKAAMRKHLALGGPSPETSRPVTRQDFSESPEKLIRETEAEVMRSDPILQFFEYGHFKPEMQAVSKPFGDLAKRMVQHLPRNPERTVALRKLLESKDAAVRAFIAK